MHRTCFALAAVPLALALIGSQPMAATTTSTASSFTHEPCPAGSLEPDAEPVAVINPPPEDSVTREEGLSAFERVYKVVSHPRCANCHVGADGRANVVGTLLRTHSASRNERQCGPQSARGRDAALLRMPSQ